VDGNDQVEIVEGDYDRATLACDESTVARVTAWVEIFSETIFDNGFRFYSGALDPTQSVLGLSRKPHSPLRAW